MTAATRADHPNRDDIRHPHPHGNFVRGFESTPVVPVQVFIEQRIVA